MTTELFAARDLPVFQNKTYATAQAARDCARGDLRLVQDTRTGLIYNADFDPDRIVYDEEYQNEQAHSPAFRAHLDDVTAVVERLLGRDNLLEVGCGKGYFVDMLGNRGFDVKGIDPAYEGSDPRIVKAPFTAEAGLRGDGIILRHVLEHMPDPVSFLRAIANANGNRGLIYIEVPCFDWIVARQAWFDLFYEHVNYFRLSDFDRIFGRVVESGRLFGGQYLYVVGDLATVRDPVAAPDDLITLPEGFGEVRSLTTDAAGSTAIWGASSKGVIFAAAATANGVPLSFAVDINPVKQGRFLPVSALPVRAPDAAMSELADDDRILVMNSNYLAEIKAMTNNRFRYETIDHE